MVLSVDVLGFGWSGVWTHSVLGGDPGVQSDQCSRSVCRGPPRLHWFRGRPALRFMLFTNLMKRAYFLGNRGYSEKLPNQQDPIISGYWHSHRKTQSNRK